MKPVMVDDALLLSAVRYALGRQTYIVGETVREVLAVWPSLSHVRRRQIRHEVYEALKQEGPLAVSPIDRAEWQRLLDWAASDE